MAVFPSSLAISIARLPSYKENPLKQRRIGRRYDGYEELVKKETAYLRWDTRISSILKQNLCSFNRTRLGCYEQRSFPMLERE